MNIFKLKITIWHQEVFFGVIEHEVNQSRLVCLTSVENSI